MAKPKKPSAYDHEQVYAGVPFAEPKGRPFKLACCHCGLVHEVIIEDTPASEYENSVYLTMRENASYTKRYRKHNEESLICGPKTPPQKPITSSRRRRKS